MNNWIALFLFSATAWAQAPQQMTFVVQPWHFSTVTKALAIDTSVPNYTVQQIAADGTSTTAPFTCAPATSNYAGTISCTAPFSRGIYVATSNSTKPHSSHIFNFTPENPTAGSAMTPIVLTPYDTDLTTYLTSLIGHSGYQLFPSSSVDQFAFIYQDYTFFNLSNPQPNALTAYLNNHPTLFYNNVILPISKPICASLPSFFAVPWAPTGSLSTSQCIYSGFSAYPALATPTSCSNYAAPNSGVVATTQPGTGWYALKEANLDAFVLGEFSTTQFSSDDSISYTLDTTPRMLALTGSNYFAVTSPQDLWLFSKCNNGPLLGISFVLPKTAKITLSGQPNALSTHQTSHLQMLAVKITESNYSALQTACSQQATASLTGLIEEFMPSLAILNPGIDLIALADWIGSSGCLCAPFWEYPEATDVVIDNDSSLNIVLPLGVPGVTVNWSANLSGATGSFNTDNYGVGGQGSSQIQAGDQITFNINNTLVQSSCTIPPCPVFLNGRAMLLQNGSCQPCPLGNYVSNNQCIACPTNQIVINNVCTTLATPVAPVTPGNTSICKPCIHNSDCASGACLQGQAYGLNCSSYPACL